MLSIHFGRFGRSPYCDLHLKAIETFLEYSVDLAGVEIQL